MNVFRKKINVLFIWVPKAAGSSIYRVLKESRYRCKRLLNRNKGGVIEFPYTDFDNKGAVTFSHASIEALMEHGIVKTDFFENALPFVTKASRYLGNEINAIRKDLSEVDLKFVLAFPDVYEVGMSHLGFHILYHILNSHDHIACERVFAPWPDMESVMRQQNFPLSTLESHIPLRAYDIIGFSLEYELSYATILKMFSLSGIPFLSRDRDESFPLMIAGGPSTFNPEPVADFFDAIVIGEAEEVICEICDTFLTWKRLFRQFHDIFRIPSKNLHYKIR